MQTTREAIMTKADEDAIRDIDMRALGYECTKHVAGERAMHVFLGKRA